MKDRACHTHRSLPRGKPGSLRLAAERIALVGHAILLARLDVAETRYPSEREFEAFLAAEPPGAEPVVSRVGSA